MEQTENSDRLLASTRSVKIGTELVTMIFQHVMHRLGFVFRPIRRMFRSMISKTIQLSDLLPSIDQLQTGKQLSVSLAVKEGKVELEGVMIEGWGNQGSIDGSIIM